ncbi:MAG: hypothetical protein HPY46_00435 [Candidatus Aminicenantes bacterium]|nr:hypothetical protein [Candidatus Aminicenantes bacterium]
MHLRVNTLGLNFLLFLVQIIQAENIIILAGTPTLPLELRGGREFILVINQEVVECPLCIDKLDGFLRFVKIHNLESNILAILALDPSINYEEKYIQYLEKQIKGYLMGNDMRFPVLVDRAGLFCQKNITPPLLISFNFLEGKVDVIKLPFNDEKLKRLIGFTGVEK